MAQMKPQKISISYLISLTQTWVPIFSLRLANIPILKKNSIMPMKQLHLLTNKILEQAGAELRQAQTKLG